jgi:hypothetical protein
MRTLILAALFVIATPTAARADLGIGLFVGEPLGLDVKIDIGRRQALDFVFGVVSVRDGGRDLSYGHLTYLLTPFAGVGQSIVVPLRIGIGGAVIGVVEGDVGIAARAPLQLGFMFRRTPLEIYLEIALKVTFLANNEADVLLDSDGGIGLRFYF